MIESPQLLKNIAIRVWHENLEKHIYFICEFRMHYKKQQLNVQLFKCFGWSRPVKLNHSLNDFHILKSWVIISVLSFLPQRTVHGQVLPVSASPWAQPLSDWSDWTD